MPFGNVVNPPKNTMFENILNQYMNQQKSKQTQQNWLQTMQQRKSEQDRNFSLQQSAENRQQTLMPSLLQQREDVHKTSQQNLGIQQKAAQRTQEQFAYILQEYKDKHKRAMSEQEANQLYIDTYKGNYAKVLDESQNGMSNQDVQQAPAQQPQQEYGQLQTQQQNDSMIQNLMNPGTNTDLEIPQQQMQEPQAQQAKQPQQPQQVQQEPVQSTNPYQQLQQRLDNGEEVVVRPSTKGKEGWDNLAGTSRLGLNIPKVERRVVDGVEYRTYPSGKKTKTKVGPSTEEKAEIALDTAKRKEQASLNAKESIKAETSGSTALKSAEYLKNMTDQLLKDPKLTSVWYGTPIVGQIAKRMSGEGLGNFEGSAAAFQAEAAKLASTRGGIGIVNFMKTTKPSEDNEPKRNIGMLKANAAKIQGIYDDERKSWERKNPGQEYPIEDPKIVDYVNKLDSINNSLPPKEHLEATAKKYGISVDEVIKRYNAKRK